MRKKTKTLEEQTAKVDAIAGRLRGADKERAREEAVDAYFSPFADPWENACQHGINPKEACNICHPGARRQPQAAQSILERYRWKEVHAPKPWLPKIPGTELAGFYGGRTTRSGSYGQYDVILVHVPARGTFMVSGVKAIQLVDAAMIDVGHPIRVVWDGLQECGTDAAGKAKHMKLFRVLVAEGEPIDAEDLPRVSQ